MLVACVNALAPWGDGAARRAETLLQLGTGLGAFVCGVVVAVRVSGPARWWRLSLAVGLAAFLVGQALWWSGGGNADGGVVAPAILVAYFACQVFVLASMYFLVRSSGGVLGWKDAAPRHSAPTTFLDGVLVAASFVIFVSLGDFGTRSTAALPRAGPGVELVYSVAELVAVVVAVVITMIYPKGRPHRANYLLLAAGIVTMASADRLAAYFEFVGSAGGQRWAGIGFVLGPLMFAYAMLDRPPPRPVWSVDRPSPGADWVQLILPYVVLLGMAMLFAFHISIGRPLTGFVICMAVLMVLLVSIRQVVAVRAHQLVTQRLYAAQRALEHQLHTDALTGLPNRLLFGKRLDAALVDGRFVLIFVDLDDFKELNSRFGHGAGDDLLRAVGKRLQRCVRDVDTVARVGGDEFAILIDGSVEEPDIVADRLRGALRVPFPVHGSSVRVRASMGLVRPGPEGLSQTSDDLLRQADISMYAGKRIGKDTAVIYQPSSDVRGDFPTALREAAGGIPAGFSLVYQPIVRLPDGVLMAVEVLARWTAPNGIDISPETFVAAAEEAGLGADLDTLVLELACSEIQAAGLDIDFHVNIGAARLGNPYVEELVSDALARHRVKPSRLVVEITEQLPIVDLAAAAGQIARLNAIGVGVALDDFGSGYNSLLYLHSLPVQVVKLDRRFAAGVDPEHDQALYRSIIGLCDELGMKVIIEGIEYPPQAKALYAAGCRLAQGHLFGRAVSITELSAHSAAQGAPT